MSVRFARPDVGTLALRVFARPLHPELFDSPLGVRLRAGDVVLEIRLCPSGHTWMWRRDGRTLTEVTADQELALPTTNILLEQRIRGCRTRSVTLTPDLRYDVGCQVEVLDPEIFQRLQDELRDDATKAELAHEFASANRFTPGALSLVRTELTRNSTLIHAFHTFPEHAAIVKTQSLIEWS